MGSDAATLIVLIAGTGAGAAIDLRARRVPNALTLSLAAAGVAMGAAGVGRVGAGAALAGCAIGLVLMLPGHLLGATGGGDVKLLAAAGTLLGPAGTLRAFLFATVAGGALALAVAARRGRARRAVRNTAQLVLTAGGNAADIESPAANNRFAYAPAIALGATLAALGS